jgi:putative adenylate-forming enzyme
LIPRLHAPLSFATARRWSRPGLSRERFLELQERALQRWLTHSVPKVRAFAGKPRKLDDRPVMDKAMMMTDFASYNIAAITASQVHAPMSRDFRIGSFIVGASTGTSGNRGLFVISEQERFRWLGTILAKTMADLLWRRQRVAILLPQGTALYESANRFRQIELRFFDVTFGPAGWRAVLEKFDPTVIVAAPRILRHMAEERFQLHPVRVFSAAETLDPVDRSVIEAAFAQPLEQI